MLKHTLIASIGSLLFVLPVTSFAQEPPTITVKKSDTLSVSISGVTGPDSGSVAPILGNDLNLAGGLSISPEASAAYVVKGTANSGSLSGSVTDRSGKVLFQKNYSGSSRANAHAFADDVVFAILGQKGLAGSKLAFVSARTGRKEIYISDYDGTNIQQLTKENNISVGPCISPDGRKMVYTGYQSGYADVYLVDFATGNRTRIIKYPGTNTGAVFSPDGSRLAVSLSKDGNPELYVTGANGSGARRLTRTKGVESSPTWSPDGNELIYVSDDGGSPQLYRISANGGTPSKISTGYGYCTEPSWSPDGKKLAFNVRTGGGLQIAVLDFATGAVRLMTTGSNAEDPAFGPNSRSILFVQGGKLYMIDSVTGRKTQIAGEVSRISEPSWSRN